MLKLNCLDLMSSKSDLYGFKMALFDNGDPEGFLLFVMNFQMILKASRILASGMKIKYLRMLLHVKALFHINVLYSKVISTVSKHLKSIVLCLGTYFFPIHLLSKQKRTIRHVMSNPHGLTVILHLACMIDSNNYLAVFPGSKASNNKIETELK